jgi:hypothetical protein
MEFQHNLVVHEINPITKEVTKKRTNLVPSFTTTSFVMLLKLKLMTAFIKMRFMHCSRKRVCWLRPRRMMLLST